jgi:hypothetical protein
VCVIKILGGIKNESEKNWDDWLRPYGEKSILKYDG